MNLLKELIFIAEAKAVKFNFKKAKMTADAIIDLDKQRLEYSGKAGIFAYGDPEHIDAYLGSPSVSAGDYEWDVWAYKIEGKTVLVVNTEHGWGQVWSSPKDEALMAKIAKQIEANTWGKSHYAESVNEAAESEKQIIKAKVKVFGCGVYEIPASAKTYQFDSTEHTLGNAAGDSIESYNDSVESGDIEEASNIISDKVAKILRSHDEFVEIKAYDGSSGDESESLLIVGGPSDVTVVDKHMQLPDSDDEEYMDDIAEMIAKKTGADVEDLKSFVRSWDTPNKIYTFKNGAKTIVMIAEND